METCWRDRPAVIIMTWLVAALSFIMNSAVHSAQPPTITHAYPNSPGMVTVAYAHPGDDGVRRFVLEQQGIATDRGSSAHLADNFVVANLQPGTNYSFRVCAQYDSGEPPCSPWSAITTFASQAQSSPQLPPDVRSVTATLDTVTIRWGNVGDYNKLLVRVEDERGNSDQREILNPNGFASFTFPGMRHSTRYKLLVKGCGDPAHGACGPWSEGHWVQTTRSSQCIPNYVWREAYPGDQVCVLPAVRDQAAADNAAAASRIAPCRPGFVPRAAVRGDNVCVEPSARALAASENTLNIERSTFVQCVKVTEGTPTQCANPAPCKQGFSYRKATPKDYVCVPNEAISRVMRENAAHDLNKGVNACKAPFVWRVAAPHDLVCVQGDVRKQTAQDNAAAASRVVR